MNFKLKFIALFFLIVGSCKKLESNQKQKDWKIEGRYVNTKNVSTMDDYFVFKGDSLTIIKDAGYGYGLVHSFIYSIKFLENDSIYLEGIGHFANNRNLNMPTENEWHKDTLKLEKINEETLLFFNPNYDIDKPIVFKLDSNQDKKPLIPQTF